MFGKTSLASTFMFILCYSICGFIYAHLLLCFFFNGLGVWLGKSLKWPVFISRGT